MPLRTRGYLPLLTFLLSSCMVMQKPTASEKVEDTDTLELSELRSAVDRALAQVEFAEQRREDLDAATRAGFVNTKLQKHTEEVSPEGTIVPPTGNESLHSNFSDLDTAYELTSGTLVLARAAVNLLEKYLRQDEKGCKNPLVPSDPGGFLLLLRNRSKYPNSSEFESEVLRRVSLVPQDVGNSSASIKLKISAAMGATIGTQYRPNGGNPVPASYVSVVIGLRGFSGNRFFVSSYPVNSIYPRIRNHVVLKVSEENPSQGETTLREDL